MQFIIQQTAITCLFKAFLPEKRKRMPSPDRQMFFTLKVALFDFLGEGCLSRRAMR
jgi:hypothetical protein